MYNKCFNLLLFILLFLLFIDPTNSIFSLKQLVFISCFIFFIPILLLNGYKFNKYDVIFFCVFQFFSILGYSIYYFNSTGNVLYDHDYALSNLISFLFFIMIFLARVNYTNFCYLFILNSKVLILMILFLWCIFCFLKSTPMGLEIINYFNYTSQSAMITARSFGGIEIVMVYYKSAVLLIVALPLFIDLNKNNNRVWVFLILICLFISGTRTNIIISIFLFCIYILSTVKGNVRNTIYSLAIPSVLLAVLYLVYIVLSSNDGSNFTKINNIISYLNLFSSSYKYYFIGDGFGSYIYSLALNKYILYSELVYFDLFRFYGGVAFIIFMFFLTIPLWVFLKKKEYIYLSSYLSYLVVMGTNPLFVSSTGILAMVVYFIKVSNVLSMRSPVE